jgi:hypothetical protein
MMHSLLGGAPLAVPRGAVSVLIAGTSGPQPVGSDGRPIDPSGRTRIVRVTAADIGPGASA